MKWFPDDWSRDTKMLTVAAKGGWIEILTALHAANPRGELTMSVEQWARVIGCEGEQAGSIMQELDKARVCDLVMLSNGHVTVSSRRMKREAHEWELNRQRVARHREKKEPESGNADVTPDVMPDVMPEKRSCNDDVMGKKLEARSQKLDKTVGRVGKPPAPTAADLISSFSADPAYKGIDVPREVEKCRLWSEVHRKKFSKARVVNWLNRCEAPLVVGSNGGAKPDPYREPEGWRSIAQDLYPDSEFSDRVRDGLPWSEVSLDVRAQIAKKCHPC